MIKPMRDQLLIENVKEEEEVVNGIALPFKARELSRKKVLAVGPDVWDNIKVGDIVLSPGKTSGVDMGDDTYLISEEICYAIEEGE